MTHMKTFKAQVVKGRLVLDEPCALPEGTVLHLVVADEVDLDEEMDPEERAEFEAALERSMEDVKTGRLVPAEEVLAELRTRR
jgi:hypothetical protein